MSDDLPPPPAPSSEDLDPDLDSLLSQIHNQSVDYDHQTQDSLFFPRIERSNFSHPGDHSFERHFEGISLSHQELNPNASYFEPKGIPVHEWNPPLLFTQPSDHRKTTGPDTHLLYPPFSTDQVQTPNSYGNLYEHPWRAPQPQGNFISALASQPLPYRSQQPAVPPRLTITRPPIDLKRDSDLELTVCHCARIVLFETPSKCLKSVELANSLRDRIGKDSLQRTKALYGGLLVLLELFPQHFFVHRIPKNDMVELIDHSSPYASFPHHQRSTEPRFPIPPMNLQQYNVDQVQPKPIERVREIKPPAVFVAPARPTDHFIVINDVPDALTGGDLWNEFGGAGIVQKVSLDFQGTKRTGIIYFTSDEVASKSFQLHSAGKWKGRLVYRQNVEKKANGLAKIDHAEPVATSTENRLVTIRTEQLPHFYQDVLRELCNFTFAETDPWKRCTIPDYLFCQLMTEMLKPHPTVPLPITKLKDTLRDTFRRTILLPPLKALLRAYPEYFDVNDDVSLVRATSCELPPLNDLEDLIS